MFRLHAVGLLVAGLAVACNGGAAGTGDAGRDRDASTADVDRDVDRSDGGDDGADATGDDDVRIPEPSDVSPEEVGEVEEPGDVDVPDVEVADVDTVDVEPGEVDEADSDAAVSDIEAPDADAPDGEEGTDAVSDVVDAGTRPVGQCVTSADCPGIAYCAAEAPGGVCNGCGSDTDCPESTDECSEFGACRTMCDVDEQCPLGFVCGVTGYCVVQQCIAGVCPVPFFGCSGGNRCERVACEAGTECPPGTACTSGRCIEPR